MPRVDLEDPHSRRASCQGVPRVDRPGVDRRPFRLHSEAVPVPVAPCFRFRKIDPICIGDEVEARPVRAPEKIDYIRCTMGQRLGPGTVNRRSPHLDFTVYLAPVRDPLAVGRPAGVLRRPGADDPTRGMQAPEQGGIAAVGHRDPATARACRGDVPRHAVVVARDVGLMCLEGNVLAVGRDAQSKAVNRTDFVHSHQVVDGDLPGDSRRGEPGLWRLRRSDTGKGPGDTEAGENDGKSSVPIHLRLDRANYQALETRSITKRPRALAFAVSYPSPRRSLSNTGGRSSSALLMLNKTSRPSSAPPSIDGGAW